MLRLMLGFLILCITSLSYAMLQLPYIPVTFPRDHAAHYNNVPYSFRHIIEWWYFNGHAFDDKGKELTYDVALFNPALNNNGVITLPILHIQVADLDNKKAYGTSRLYPFRAGRIGTDKLDILIGQEFLLRQETQNGKDVFILKAADSADGVKLDVDLVLESISAPFLINGNGLLPMPDNTNTYYYTVPRFKTTGSIKINDAVYQISKTPGESWMDHEWGDFLVNNYGWEWFSIRLDNGFLANIFLSVEFKTKAIVGGLANVILPNGEKHYIQYKDFIVTRDNYWHDPKLNEDFPMTYHINFPQFNLELTNTASFPEQEFHGYWEGYCYIKGTYNKQPIKGYSYTEIVYSNPVPVNPLDNQG